MAQRPPVQQQNSFAREAPRIASGQSSQMGDTGRLTHTSNIQAMMMQSGVNQSHMEIMHKQ